MSERFIELIKDDSNTFGFNIKGGIDLGCPVYIWRVEPDSLADNAGILSGDEILSANEIDFTQITHSEALKVLKSSLSLNLFLRTSHLPTNGNTNYYSWVESYSGEPTSPPNDLELLRAPRRLVDLIIDTGQNLGLMIRGGAEYGLGIYITGVDRGSVAERMGLKRGDEILQVNTKSFTNLAHDAAVNILKSSRKMILTLAYIGKIPIDLKDFDKSTSSVLGMIEEKARTVLNKSEHSRFTFYRLEYTNGFLCVSTFVRILLELLNTEEKYTLLTEVREIIRQEDLQLFDELIYDKDSVTNLKGCPVDELSRTPDLRESDGIHDRDRDEELPLAIPHSISPQQEINSGDLIYLREFQQQETGNSFLRPGPPTLTGATERMDPQQRMQMVTDRDGITKKELVPNLGQGASAGNSTPAIRYRVRIQKSKPTLGITVEGGSNTSHRLPRIINIHPTGSGYENANLKPGVVIVSVDGTKLDGLTHEEAVKVIKDSYDGGKKFIDLIVVENRSNCIVLGGIGGD